jgi:hypothetical protein
VYADDSIILSESAEGLQHCLNKLHGYCKHWHLDIDLDKTKVIIMKSGGGNVKHKFMYNNREFITTNTYRYLGTTINSKGNFSMAKEELKNKGLKAMFTMWSSISPGKIPPVALATKLFDAIIKPIILLQFRCLGLRESAIDTKYNE